MNRRDELVNHPRDGRRRRRGLITVLALLSLLIAGLASTAAADHNEDPKHCPQHDHNVKVEDTAPGSSTSRQVDGQTVWLHFDEEGDSVRFTSDEAGNEPIAVDFCIKAGQQNSGEQTGTEGHVTWTNGGGQTPDISYVVIYGIADCDVAGGDAQFLDLEDEMATNDVGTDHTVTATVTDADGNPCPGVAVRFEVEGANPGSGSGTTGTDGTTTFTWTGNNAGDDVATACFDPNDPTTEPQSCPDTDPDDANDSIDESDAVTKTWTDGGGGAALCRAAVLVNPLTGGPLAVANDPGDPCLTDDGDLLNLDPIPVVAGRADTDDSDTSAAADVVLLDGGDMGSISLIGARDSCADGEDAWIVRIHDGSDEALRVSSDSDPDATIGLPGLNDGSAGIFWTGTDDGKAQALVLTDGSDDIIVGSEAEASCS